MATESIQYTTTEIVVEKDTDVELISSVQEQVLVEEVPTIEIVTEIGQEVVVDQQVTSEIVETPSSVIEIVEQGIQGPPGPPGESGGNNILIVSRHSPVPISALKIVYEDNNQIFVLDNKDEDNIDRLLGLTISSVSSAGSVNVQIFGVIDDSNWSFTPGKVWLGSNGAIKQDPPEDGFDVCVGKALSATRLLLNIEETIQLED